MCYYIYYHHYHHYHHYTMSSRPCTSRQSSHASQASQSSQPSGQPQNIIYKAVMTPIIFVSFLLSLAWVEFRYSVLRSHSHDNNNTKNSNTDDCRHPWMPSWLHKLVYRRQDYQYVVVRRNETDKADPKQKNERYYHSMQRKLLKMETDEAFRIRTTVLAIIAGGAAVAIWGAVAGVRWLSWVLA